MSFLLFVAGLALLVLSIVLIARPQAVWWGLISWVFEKPDANEPSDAGFFFMRVAGGLGFLVVVMLIGNA